MKKAIEAIKKTIKGINDGVSVTGYVKNEAVILEALLNNKDRLEAFAVVNGDALDAGIKDYIKRMHLLG